MHLKPQPHSTLEVSIMIMREQKGGAQIQQNNKEIRRRANDKRSLQTMYAYKRKNRPGWHLACGATSQKARDLSKLLFLAAAQAKQCRGQLRGVLQHRQELQSGEGASRSCALRPTEASAEAEFETRAQKKGTLDFDGDDGARSVFKATKGHILLLSHRLNDADMK